MVDTKILFFILIFLILFYDTEDTDSEDNSILLMFILIFLILFGKKKKSKDELKECDC